MAGVLVIEHEANAGVGLIGERLHAAGIPVTVVGPETNVKIPDSVDGFQAMIVLGGTPGPADDHTAAWLPLVRILIRQCLDREIPFLGICLGAQLLAVVAGGSVGPVRTAPEIGLHTIAVSAAAAGDPLLGGLEGELLAMQWHFLEVHRLPAGSVPLCSSAQCDNQAFRVGRVAWGLQFHIEALTATVVQWAQPGSADLEELDLTSDDIVAPVLANEQALRDTWADVADRWISLIPAAMLSAPSSAASEG